MAGAKPTAAAIRQAKLDNPKKRERDLAAELGISEAEYVDAWTGQGTFRITTDFDRIFPRIGELGPVTALTRNENAVHEKIGVYDNFRAGKHAAMMLGAVIDMRMFPRHWAYGFAVENDTGETVKRSFQFFDAHGTRSICGPTAMWRPGESSRSNSPLKASRSRWRSRPQRSRPLRTITPCRWTN